MARSNGKCLILLIFLGGFVYWLQWQESPSGCGRVRLWSHRGHVDATRSNQDSLTCRQALEKLSANDIRHFDIDVLLHNSVIFVAHPTEMSGTADSPAPCSKIPLEEFIDTLKETHAKGGFYFTMEPKSAWIEEGPYLQAPQLVIGNILDVLNKHPVPNRSCALILESGQAADSRIQDLVDRVGQNHCQLARSFRRNAAPLRQENVPSETRDDYYYALTMPTIELFGGTDGYRFLQTSVQEGLQTILWVIDTRVSLRKTLQLDGVHGAITNRPLAMKALYQSICKADYSPGV